MNSINIIEYVKNKSNLESGDTDIIHDDKFVTDLIEYLQNLEGDEARLRFMAISEDEANGLDISHYCKVFIIGYMEYIFRKNGLRAPKWTLDKKYSLVSLSDNPIYWILKPESSSKKVKDGFEKVIKNQLNNSIEEFKTRRFILEQL